MMGWTIPLDKLAEKTGVALETVVQKSTADLFRAIVEKSPVDTGRFKGNWNVSQNAPNLATTEAANPQRGVSEANNAQSIPVGGVAYLANGLPYARRLEYGWSKQSPAGMVRVSVIEFSEYVKRAIK